MEIFVNGCRFDTSNYSVTAYWGMIVIQQNKFDGTNVKSENYFNHVDML